VHQLIETIEYILGCVSNTASYLRLWALSLAHSQLSEVFFEKSVEHPLILGYPGIPLVQYALSKMVINFVLLSLVTFAVLMCMDGMECFLHALRLHW
jgi:V-type H+-transporting ATPase subunit a